MWILKDLISNRKLKAQIKRIIRNYRQFKIKSLKQLSGRDFEDILINDLDVKSGDTLFIHSSIDNLNLSCSPFDLLNIILDSVGSNGTIVFPTYPQGYSYNFLKSNKTFDQKKTPSSTGILSEVARRHKKAFRSLHPTKSVVAIGYHAEDITKSHHLSSYPYDIQSPYYKIYNYDSKILGIGIKSTYLSCVHTVDDTYKKDFIVDVYHKQLFDAICVNSNGDKLIVRTYAHDMNKMKFNLPKYFKKYIDYEICSDLKIGGYDFFKADAKNLYNSMINLYETDKTTIYPKSLYRKEL